MKTRRENYDLKKSSRKTIRKRKETKQKLRFKPEEVCKEMQTDEKMGPWKKRCTRSHERAFFSRLYNQFSCTSGSPYVQLECIDLSKLEGVKVGNKSEHELLSLNQKYVDLKMLKAEIDRELLNLQTTKEKLVREMEGKKKKASMEGPSMPKQRGCQKQNDEMKRPVRKRKDKVHQYATVNKIPTTNECLVKPKELQVSNSYYIDDITSNENNDEEDPSKFIPVWARTCNTPSLKCANEININLVKQLFGVCPKATKAKIFKGCRIPFCHRQM